MVRAGFVIVALMASAPALATTNLVCPGTAAKDKSTSTTVITPSGGVGLATTSGRVNFDDSVSFKLEEKDGLARVPKKIMPAYKDGGKDGWFPIVNLVRKDDEITGAIRFHSMYKPKFRLDRITGRLVLNGNLGDFVGECVAYDPATVEKKF